MEIDAYDVYEAYCDIFDKQNVIHHYGLAPRTIAVVLANRDEVIFELTGVDRWILKSHDQWLDDILSKRSEGNA